MLNMFKKILKTGVVTEDDLFTPAPARYRGKIKVATAKCDGCEQCVHVCPANAIRLTELQQEAELMYDYTQCILCGLCVDHCPPGALTQTRQSPPATRSKTDLVETYRIPKRSSVTTEGVERA